MGGSGTVLLQKIIKKQVEIGEGGEEGQISCYILSIAEGLFLWNYSDDNFVDNFVGITTTSLYDLLVWILF